MAAMQNTVDTHANPALHDNELHLTVEVRRVLDARHVPMNASLLVHANLLRPKWGHPVKVCERIILHPLLCPPCSQSGGGGSRMGHLFVQSTPAGNRPVKAIVDMAEAQVAAQLRWDAVSAASGAMVVPPAFEDLARDMHYRCNLVPVVTVEDVVDMMSFVIRAPAEAVPSRAALAEALRAAAGPCYALWPESGRARWSALCRGIGVADFIKRPAVLTKLEAAVCSWAAQPPSQPLQQVRLTNGVNAQRESAMSSVYTFGTDTTTVAAVRCLSLAVAVLFVAPDATGGRRAVERFLSGFPAVR